MNGNIKTRATSTCTVTAVLLQLFIAASATAADQAPSASAAEPAAQPFGSAPLPSPAPPSVRPAQTPSTDKPAYIPVLPPDLDLGLCDEG